MISFLLSVRQPLRFLAVILYVGCIAALTLLPAKDLPQIPLFRGADKIIHFIMYFFFSIVFCWALKTELNYTRLFFIIPATIGWGVFMEIMQLQMHRGRSFSEFDMLANTIGVFAGVLFFTILARKYSALNSDS